MLVALWSSWDFSEENKTCKVEVHILRDDKKIYGFRFETPLHRVSSPSVLISMCKSCVQLKFEHDLGHGLGHNKAKRSSEWLRGQFFQGLFLPVGDRVAGRRSAQV